MNKSLLLMAGALLAATSLSVSATSSTGVYVGIDGGRANLGDNESTSGYQVTSDVSKVGFIRGMVGYRFSENLALEAGYFGSGNARLEQNNGVRSESISANVRGADFAAIYKFTEGLPGLFFKGGLSYAKVSMSERSGGAGSSYQADAFQTGMGYLVGLGYEVDFFSNWSANIAYTRYQRLAGLENAKMGVISAGLKYRF
jgi:opacity protein-like surface antigen